MRTVLILVAVAAASAFQPGSSPEPQFLLRHLARTSSLTEKGRQGFVSEAGHGGDSQAVASTDDKCEQSGLYTPIAFGNRDFASALIKVKTGTAQQRDVLPLLTATAPYSAERLEFVAAVAAAPAHSAAVAAALTLLLYNDRAEDAARLLLSGLRQTLRTSAAAILSHADALAAAIDAAPWAPARRVFELAKWLHDQRMTIAASVLFARAMRDPEVTVPAYLSGVQHAAPDIIVSPDVVAAVGPALVLAALLLATAPRCADLASAVSAQYDVRPTDALAALLRLGQHGRAARLVHDLGMSVRDLPPRYTLVGDGRALLSALMDLHLVDAVVVLVQGAQALSLEVASALRLPNDRAVNAVIAHKPIIKDAE